MPKFLLVERNNMQGYIVACFKLIMVINVINLTGMTVSLFSQTWIAVEEISYLSH